MKKLLLVALALAAAGCAPGSLIQTARPYEVRNGEMTNNFLPAEYGDMVQINFKNTGYTKNMFVLIYEGPGWRFLEGPAEIWIDGQKFSASGGKSSRSTLTRTVLEINTYDYSEEVREALKGAQTLTMKFSGGVPLQIQFPEENLKRVKSFLWPK